VPAGGSRAVKITVRADATATGAIRHRWYFSSSDTDQPLTGPLITTNVTTGGTTAYVDLITSVDDAASSVMWGQHGTWSVTVRNAGPSTATDAPIVTNLPPQLSNLTWTCSAQSGASCAAATGTGAVNTTATIPAGKSVTFTVEADVISGSGTALLSFTAVASAPSGAVESFSLDNGAGDDDTISGSLVSVAVTRDGTGSGSIVSAPSGVTCGANCTSTTGSFALGSQVTMQAVPATGSVFTGWSGGTCSGTGACTFTVAAAQTITATFSANPILVTSPNTARAAVGRSFSFTVTALGTAPISIDATGLPAWLSFDAQTAVLSGTAPAAGSFPVNLSATDVNGTATQVLTITAGQAPTITSALTFTVAGATTAWSSVLVTASGATPVQYNASNLPGTVYFNSTTGRFAGNAGAVGVYNVPVIATNAFGSDFKVLAVSVGGAPVITSGLSLAATVGTAFSYTLTATGSPTITLSVNSLPAWASFDSGTGVISGTPTSAGTVSIGLRASNGVGVSNQTLVLTVDGPAVITSGLTASGTAGDPFTYSLTAEGTAPITSTITNLPAWLTFDAQSGLASGTPPAGGTFTATLGASNALGSDSKTLTITIASPPPSPTAPSINSALTASCSVGTACTYTITASGQVPMTFSASGLPSWASVDTSTGVISGTPDASGSVSIGLGAINAIGSDSETLVLTVVQPATITSALTASGRVGTPFSYVLTATGSTPLTLSASGLPSWASFSSLTGEISGTPTADGVSSISLGASNVAGADNQTLVLTVRTAPDLTSALTADAVTGVAFSYVVTATGSNPLTFTTGTLPSWLSFNAGTRTLSGTPSAEGTVSVSLGVSNAAGSDSDTLLITIRARPAITSVASAEAVVGDAFVHTLTATGTAPITWSASGLPSWASLDPQTGVISGTPTGAGVSSISIGATNSAGSDTQTLIVTARTRPALTSALVADAIVGVPFSHLVTATGTAPLTFSAGTLPSWLVFDSGTRRLSGTPPAEGQFSVSLGVSNAAGSDTHTLEITVRARPVITSASSADGVVGDAFVHTLTATGTAPITWSASGLPSWASLDPQTGVISGTPNADGAIPVAVQASNAAGTDSQSLILTTRTRPLISALSRSAIVGSPFSYVVIASGTTPHTFSVSGLPAWASFNASTGEISGTPTDEATLSIALQVSNAAGADSATLTLTVRTAAVVLSSTAADAVVGQPFSYAFTASGTAPVTITVTGLPSWATFDADTGLISGTPKSEGISNVGLWASNAAGTDAKMLEITSRTVPRITSMPFATAIVGDEFTFEVTSIGTSPRVLSAAGLPSWLTFDADTGLLRGIPPGDGTTALTLVVTNVAGTDLQVLSITAHTRPTITNPRLVRGVVGRSLAFELGASGSAPLQFSVQSLPPGLSFDGLRITGVPTAAGTFGVLERVTNDVGLDTATVVFEVRQMVPAPSIEFPAEGAVLGMSAVTISGSAPISEFGSTIEVSEGNAPVCVATVQNDGTWSCAATLAEGAHEITAVLTDVNGFAGAVVDTQRFRVDLTAPAAPAWTGPSAGPIAEARPTLTGSGEPGAFIEITFNGQFVCSAWVTESGTWSCTPSAPLPEGSITLDVSQRDAAGFSMPGAPLVLVVDTRAPVSPLIDSPLRGALLSNPRPTITGSAEPGSTVKVSIDGVVVCTVSASVEGTFTCTPDSSLSDGVHSVSVISSDAAGNLSRTTGTQITIDTTKPAAPIIAAPSGRLTVTSTTISGSAEPGSTVTVTLDGRALCTTSASAEGNWSCPATGLSDGMHDVTAFSLDAAGHQSEVATSRFEVQTASGSMTPMGTMLTTDNAQLCGSATPGAQVNVYVDGKLVGTTSAGSDGSWCFDLPLMSAGQHRSSIGVMNANGDEVYRSPESMFEVEKPSVDFGGGIGCSSTSQAPVGVLAFLAMFFLARRRRSVGAVAVAAVVALPALAQVQSVSNFELEQLQLNPGARAGLAVGGGDLLAPKDWRISASLGYQYAPLKYFESGRLKATLVDHRLTATLNGAASVLPWLELGATVPVVLMQNGESVLSRTGDMVVSGVPTGAALGTPWLHGRIAFFQERTGAPIDLGMTVMVGLPLGSGASLTRESSISWQLMLGAGRTVGPVRFAAEVGAHLREQVVLVEGSEAIGSRVLANAGVSTVGGKLRGELSLRTFMPLTKQPVSAEVLLGGRYAIGEWELFGLAGPGFGNAPGTPMFRAVLGASFGGQASARCGGRSHLADECPELDFDGDGLANADDACPTDHAVTSNGCVTIAPTLSELPPVEEAVLTEEGGDEPPPPAEEVPALATLAAGRIELKGTVYFDSAKAVLQARSFPLLEEVAALMKAHPEVKKITIEGHTDGRGDAAFNLKLSSDRAAAVKTWLVNAGIDAERLDSKGYGLTKPIADNATLEGRERNRRVEFIVME
jgi:uncharacterized repeat protein (TIGR01451 family)